ncbi:MAG: hypothetical protein ACOC1F_00510 [Myxococcota bacterium]
MSKPPPMPPNASCTTASKDNRFVLLVLGDAEGQHASYPLPNGGSKTWTAPMARAFATPA